MGAAPGGKIIIGSAFGEKHEGAKFIPNFLTSASIDNILDHIGSTRFQSGTLTACAFQNKTNINSTLYYCRAAPEEFNFSSNPSFIDTNGNVVVVESGEEGEQKAFTFITSVGLYNANSELLAVAKLSRPIEKNDEKDLTIRVRLDF